MASESIVLDVDFCRSHFPNLANGWVYMENAGGSYVPQSVIDHTVQFMSQSRSQPYPHHKSGALANERLKDGETRLAAMLGVDRKQLVLGANTTVNFYVLAQALRAKMDVGDEVIVTNQDHEANIGCWRQLSKSGIVVREWQVDTATGLLSLDTLRGLLTAGKTRVVCFTHASNIVAATNDVAAIARTVHDAGALVCVDGVAFGPHSPLHLADWDVDFYAFSLYKVFGPHLGVLYSKPGMEAHFKSQNHFFLDGVMPAMLNPGGRLYASVASVAGVVDYVEALYERHCGARDAGDSEMSLHAKYCKVFGLFAEHEEKLSCRLIDFLLSMPRVRILGPASGRHAVRMPTIAFVVDGGRPADIVQSVAESKVAITSSHFYSRRLVAELGVDPDAGVVRVSMVHYNTMAEVEQLCSALRPLLS